MSTRRTCTALAIAFVGSACIFCVAAGTRIATPHGAVDVAALRVGDPVWAVDPATGAMEPTTVTAVRRGRRECLALVAGGHRLVCTPDHPVYAADAHVYDPASRFAEGVHLRVQRAGAEVWHPARIDRVDPDAGVHDVFDASVASAHHNYIAEGLLVHNKSDDTGFDDEFDYLCTPVQTDTMRCPSTHRCCSDDAATELGKRPTFASTPSDDAGVPLFAGAANDRSHSGLCYDDIFRPATLEVTGCPKPCNPTWSTEQVLVVCGEDTVCCQTRPLREADCTLDPDTQRWRPVDGRDAEAAARRGDPQWGEDGTHQDPRFDGCEAFAGDRQSEAFFDCTRQLTAADQRGLCERTEACDGAPILDPCQARNREEGR